LHSLSTRSDIEHGIGSLATPCPPLISIYIIIIVSPPPPSLLFIIFPSPSRETIILSSSHCCRRLSYTIKYFCIYIHIYIYISLFRPRVYRRPLQTTLYCIRVWKRKNNNSVVDTRRVCRYIAVVGDDYSRRQLLCRRRPLAFWFFFTIFFSFSAQYRSRTVFHDLFFIVHLSARDALITHTHIFLSHCNAIWWSFKNFFLLLPVNSSSRFSHPTRFFSRRRGRYTSCTAIPVVYNNN